jgi:FlaA1/EpsC-like NDP-sugar epimerase
LREANGLMGGFHVVGMVHPSEVLNLPDLASQLRAEVAIIALDSTTQSEMRRVVDACIAASLDFKTLPWDADLRDGMTGLDQIRNVRIEDWVGGPPLDLNLEMVAAELRDRVVLLTGAAGSIGSELARQIAPFRPARLVLLDQAETDLYFLQLDLEHAWPDVELVPVVCDVTNESRLAQVFSQHRPEYVVHAAAYKHVSLMESNVFEAVRNNVLGTLLTATMAVRHGARKVLLISTDKAIRPAGVMGATKRLAERIVFGLPNLHRFGTDFRAVRFGNVLGSKGSVIPLFERQLAAGGPITVTHPLAERYFMTIPDAARLVLQVGSLPEATGATAMLDMGEPIRIVDLADKLIRFSGRVPDRDVCITFTGLRPGEKLSEDVVSAMESALPTSNSRIRISQTGEAEGSELLEQLIRLLAYLESGDRNGLLTTLCELVPEGVAPLRQLHASDVVFGVSRSTPRGMSEWRSVIDSTRDSWRERRRPLAPDPEPEGHPLDRRQGAACRRKAARTGGRRRTDVMELLQVGQLVANR